MWPGVSPRYWESKLSTTWNSNRVGLGWTCCAGTENCQATMATMAIPPTIAMLFHRRTIGFALPDFSTAHTHPRGGSPHLSHLVEANDPWQPRGTRRGPIPLGPGC